MGLGDGYFAWLGLNRSTKRHPPQVSAITGIRHEAAMRLEQELAALPRSVAPTLSEPISWLGRHDGVGELTVATGEDATRVADRLLELVDAYGLPFARGFAGDEVMLEALRARRHLAVPEYALSRLPAMLAALGRFAEAKSAAGATIAEVDGRTDAAAEHYRQLAYALMARPEATAANG